MNDNRLLIISYRLPFSFKTENRVTSVKQSAGGLVTAVKSLDLPASAPKPVWVGCADFSPRVWEKYKHLVNDDFEYVPVFLDKTTNKGFYNGFSNSVLWPLFHYFPSYVDYHDEDLNAYQAANQAVCDKVVELLQPDDLIWVHDYHFLPLPMLIRQNKPSATIGFFLHIPFPSYEILRLLPEKCRNYLLNGLLGANLVGFHTTDYRVHFLRSAQLSLGLAHRLGTIENGQTKVQTGAFPIGINYNLFHDAAADQAVVQERLDLKRSYPDKLIFSVDRLDYTKGVMQRLDALEALLRQHSEWLGKLVFILVVVPSRDQIQTYGERKQMIEQAVGRINGLFGTLTWLPIVYRYSDVTFSQLVALYTACDIALITPVRDGMNLVAKEFVASRQDQQGVLILSELTGAANELGEALLVNPLDEYEVADQLLYALAMSPDEQRQRMITMQERVASYDVKQWATDFIDALLTTQQDEQASRVILLEGDAKQTMLDQYAQAKSRLIVLDYDGTLVEFTTEPELASPTPAVIDRLSKLAANPDNKVLVISGRPEKTLEKWLGHLPISLVAEHGATSKQDGVWIRNEASDERWKETIRPLLTDFASRCKGSFIEEKEASLAWHYRGANQQMGFKRSRELVDLLEHILPSDLRLLDGQKVIEVKSQETNKGKIARQWATAQPYSFVLVMGDDQTDEDMFSALATITPYTVKIGPKPTQAHYRLNDVAQALSVLDELATYTDPA
ncbi:bifunctional alpha,alpha-trehalose-phosphate synthase (UDP-forming)/trehalose-phosphatase [Spirosoma agri]|uniref:Bifunctional alpha,alpha-trehalose-phosphate synthase (UDP-forming)/trehalose-phosphatase n=1 Tax=Spirosoma agri TaxID=1987381 RepID=A0A6M0IBR7_9BACT|nr:bifunctional alpha,alpha-trehalose-phosphate synthase (UDP-forming)/trehalose-phosphatase [Spirosoma agri]NEU65498.1 bifunctional alpha,alpha-trehalose-phosphate synthase (UDP-forming)/trehalose-phosphatase [Spirosoma agri]